MRAFEVGSNPVALSRIDVAQPLPAQRSSEMLIDFEGFERSVIEKFAHGYRGLGWDYVLGIDNQYYQGPGYVNVLSSGRMVGYSSSGYPVSVTGRVPGQRFDFTGAHFGVAWPTAEGDLLHLEAWRDGRRMYTDALIPTPCRCRIWARCGSRPTTATSTACTCSTSGSSSPTTCASPPTEPASLRRMKKPAPRGWLAW